MGIYVPSLFLIAEGKQFSFPARYFGEGDTMGTAQAIAYVDKWMLGMDFFSTLIHSVKRDACTYMCI